jgi:hypothetical protein
MSIRLLFIFEKKTGKVIDGVEIDKAAYPDRDAFAHLIRVETETLRNAHLPNGDLGFFEGGADTCESFFRWNPDFNLPGSTTLRKLPGK